MNTNDIAHLLPRTEPVIEPYNITVPELRTLLKELDINVTLPDALGLLEAAKEFAAEHDEPLVRLLKDWAKFKEEHAHEFAA